LQMMLCKGLPSLKLAQQAADFIAAQRRHSAPAWDTHAAG
jgi:hypothetical protein